MSIISAQGTLNQLQNNTSLVNFQSSRKTLGSSRLDREGFIRLILAQLQYQDPTNPQDSSQMLSQQLQLEQADQMKDLVTSNKFSQAGSMVGKQVTLVDAPWNFTTNTIGVAAWDPDTNSAKNITGTIESVRFDPSRGKALVKIGDNYYDADTIQQTDRTVYTTNKFPQAGSMMGKQATLVDAPWNFSKNTTDPPRLDATHKAKNITGLIESIRFDNTRSKALVKIGNDYYDADTIQQLDTGSN